MRDARDRRDAAVARVEDAEARTVDAESRCANLARALAKAEAAAPGPRGSAREEEVEEPPPPRKTAPPPRTARPPPPEDASQKRAAVLAKGAPLLKRGRRGGLYSRYFWVRDRQLCWRKLGDGPRGIQASFKIISVRSVDRQHSARRGCVSVDESRHHRRTVARARRFA